VTVWSKRSDIGGGCSKWDADKVVVLRGAMRKVSGVKAIIGSGSTTTGVKEDHVRGLLLVLLLSRVRVRREVVRVHKIKCLDPIRWCRCCLDF
jgi:hypothetical protein